MIQRFESSTTYFSDVVAQRTLDNISGGGIFKHHLANAIVAEKVQAGQHSR